MDIVWWAAMYLGASAVLGFMEAERKFDKTPVPFVIASIELSLSIALFVHVYSLK